MVYVLVLSYKQLKLLASRGTAPRSLASHREEQNLRDSTAAGKIGAWNISSADKDRTGSELKRSLLPNESFLVGTASQFSSFCCPR